MVLSLYVRRCHICGEVNEGTEDILKCGSCHKSLLPFFYFDKRKLAEFSDNEHRPIDPPDRRTGYGPIRGLTVYW
jgi:hypothetical protein